jgi:ectoine hydroxylase-related dioxygenase (phytanoyl-CoA dioxygenase family)
MLSNLVQDGFAIIPDVLHPATAADLMGALEREICGAAAPVSRRGDSVYAVRNLLSVSQAARDVARSAEIRRLAEPVLGPTCVAVRGILFDKTAGANWNVVWHQDLSVALRERNDVPGWGPWSVKAGVVHVQPPCEILEKMLTVRLHLDPCGPENGPLRVLPGTHKLGRLAHNQIAELRKQIPEDVCVAGSGGVLLMRPLLLHASSDARRPGHRRVLHLEFAEGILPCPLEWYEQVGTLV